MIASLSRVEEEVAAQHRLLDQFVVSPKKRVTVFAMKSGTQGLKKNNVYLESSDYEGVPTYIPGWPSDL